MSMRQDLQPSRQVRIPVASTTTGVVAVVDDDPHISGALSAYLALHKLRSAEYASGECLLRSLSHLDGKPTAAVGEEFGVAFPLTGAILDLNLPGISGFELAHRLRFMAPELPIVIITALADADRARCGSPPTGIVCLKKPFDLDALEEALFPLL
jgi:FixJ family two-component response regulator